MDGMPKYKDQTLRMILGQIFGYGVLAGVALFLWNTVGGDNWRSLGSWVLDPYAEWWGNWGDPFFSSRDGQPYAKAVYAIIIVFLLFTFMGLSTWLSMWVVGYVIMRGALGYFGAGDIIAPSGKLIAYAVGCALWLIIAKLIVSVNARQKIRSLWRKSTS